ncbi:hypothetical protein ACFOHS_18195 [Jhaorihella thermophila]
MLPVTQGHGEIVGGHLYLIHDPALKRAWERDIPGNLALAEANWPAVLGQ